MLTIGPYTFNNRLILAPMAGISDAVFRELCRQNGAGHTLAEMVASKKSLWESKKSATRHVNLSDPEPRAIQLLGTHPDELAQAAAWQVAQGAQIIDLNMGCPAKKVCDVAAGSALMRYPERVADIFKAVVSAVDVPVTVKTRTGSDHDHKNALQIGLLAQEHGLQAITIHGRTRADKFNGLAEYETIKQVKQALSIPVIANGDICTPEQAKFVLKYTLADGLMIGRAAQGYPWIFREINHYLTTHTHAEPPTSAEFYSTLLKHVLGLHDLYGETLGVRIARKHIGWYAQRLPNNGKSNNKSDGNALRKTFNALETSQAQLEHLELYFNSQPTATL
ncbi:tRNA dihydrouridine synthase DusB [Thiomicrorhabdus aquaedulcis]|uniref:tRNA dihydrouridine synthase DusB n=1 Tax=Thiomicrorhabdus aquaedulcis TaxID=2211106 RepID=UPI000FD9F111|nr:tRNA dihydrouridine synthase DusB [Thiomicrorhabdus aquaedulcis]